MENQKIINAIVPIRVCDIGGWTDTWFSKYGSIFNIAVYPYVEVQIIIENKSTNSNKIDLNIENFGDSYSLDADNIIYKKHPLIEAAIDTMKIPKDMSIRINIFSDAPPGASTGTSAAVSVALIGALGQLSSISLTPYEIASIAHKIETEKLKLQSGIQDQLASAYGGINFIQMHEYPHASVSQIQISNSIWWELEKRLAVIYIGSPHSSSEVHKKVITSLGENADKDERIDGLRKLASMAKNAIYRGDFHEFGKIMDENTEIQKKLHPDLVCAKFKEIIDIAKDYNCFGCKVNGAGGDGGSLTILCDGDMAKKRRLLKNLADKGYKSLPIYLSRQGIRVW